MIEKHTRRGFTLIELLVVVLIIGILAAIALPQYQKTVEKARIAEAISIGNSLQKAIDVYILEHGYPTGEAGIGFLGEGTAYTNETLDIELDGSMQCGASPDTYGYCIKGHFAYSIECWSDGCSIGVMQRDNIERTFVDTFYVGWEYDNYSLVWSKSPTTNQWTRTCVYEGFATDKSLGKYICDSLRAQGWN